MSFLSLSDYFYFLNTHLGVQRLLGHNHARMQVLLSMMAAEPWGREGVMEAYLSRLQKTLKIVQTLHQKELGYLSHYQARVLLASSDTRLGYSDYSLILHSQKNTHDFLAEHYLPIQVLLAMMSSQDLLNDPCGLQKAMDLFSRYLGINQSLNSQVLKVLRKTIRVLDQEGDLP